VVLGMQLRGKDNSGKLAKLLLVLSFIGTFTIFLTLIYTWPRVNKCVAQAYTGEPDENCKKFLNGITWTNAVIFAILSLLLILATLFL